MSDSTPTFRGTAMPPKPRGNILLVHAQPDALSRLASLIAQQSPSWRAATATGASSALSQIALFKPDGIVSGMNLHGPGGEPLLAMVRREHPAIARVALVDGDDASQLLAAHRDAHQVMSFGGDGTPIGDLVVRTQRVMEVLARSGVRDMVGDLTRLPSVPRTYLALVEAAADPEVDIRHVIEIVQSDPAMTVKMLQLVNSAMFGLSKRIVSIPQAVSLLGLDLIKGLALSAHVFAAMETVPHTNFSVERFQAYSLRMARLVREFLPQGPMRDLAFTAGLVHDIGQLVIAIRDPDGFGRVTERAAAEGRTLIDVEREELGVTHDEVGACLLAHWGIPFSVVECVANNRSLASMHGKPSAIHVALHAADALLGIRLCNEPESTLDVETIERAGFGAELPRWRALVEASLAAE